MSCKPIFNFLFHFSIWLAVLAVVVCSGTVPLVRRGLIYIMFVHYYMYIRFVQYWYIHINTHAHMYNYVYIFLQHVNKRCVEECEPTSIICFKSQRTICPYQCLRDSYRFGRWSLKQSWKKHLKQQVAHGSLKGRQRHQKMSHREIAVFFIFVLKFE